MVSMRYAHNLAHGEGLVWNPGGERIEGFTNPLWVLIMTLVHLAGMPIAWTSLAIQLLGLILMAMSIACIFRITQQATGSTVYAWGSSLLTGFYLPLATWSLQGMEVSLQIFLVYSAILLLIRSYRAETPVPNLFYGLLGCGVFLRMDMVLPCGFLLLCALYHFPRSRKAVLIRGGGSLLVILAGLVLFRWWYFGDVLPNTFYLKSSGIPLSTKLIRGLSVTQDFIVNMGWFLFAIPLFILIASHRSMALVLPGSIFLIQLAYSILVGGDAWEWWRHYANRYVCVGMPGFFILLAAGLGRLFQFSPGCPEENWRAPLSSRSAYFALLLISWLAVHGATTREGFNNFIKQVTFRELPLHVADNAANVAAAEWLKKVTPPTATFAVHWAGAFPYFSERTCIDLLGKNDRVIAHLPSRTPDPQAWIPGHDRWDYTWSIGRLKPDLIVATTPPQIFDQFGYHTVDTLRGVSILVSNGNANLDEALSKGSPKASDSYRDFVNSMGNGERIRGFVPLVSQGSLTNDLEPHLEPGEELIDTTILVRDIYIFTNQRLLLLNRETLTEKERPSASLPYREILDFTIENIDHEGYKARLVITLSGQTEPWIKNIRRQDTASEIYQKLNRFMQNPE